MNGILAMAFAGLLAAAGPARQAPTGGQQPQAREGYPAPDPSYRMPTRDQGRILRHGEGPDQCDLNGMREPSIVKEGDTLYLFYDGLGPQGYLACLATSKDLRTWTRHGPMLSLGRPGEPDAAFAGSPWFIKAKGLWHLFYVTATNATSPPDLVPMGPYNTMKATSKDLRGPWVKTKNLIPLAPRVGAYPDGMAYPGHIVKRGSEYLMFFGSPGAIGIARTRDLDAKWTPDPGPLFDSGHYDIENSSLYYEKANKTWFLFVNHIGRHDGLMYTDATWVFWTRDISKWDGRKRAVVLDGRNCTWSRKCIGMATVVPVGKRLAIFYDAPGGDSVSHTYRDLGLAWLDLPLAPPDRGATGWRQGEVARR